MSTIDIPILDGSGQLPGGLFGKGTAGGVAGLDADGDVINAAGSKILGVVVLEAADPVPAGLPAGTVIVRKPA